MKFHTFSQLTSAPIAHTDAGDFLFIEQPVQEVYLRGTISKQRAGLLVVTIEEKTYSVLKQQGFSIGEQVGCICTPHIEDGKFKDITIKSLEKITS